ncbi:MAG: YncE family protein [Candidatus Methylomirabilales bacterium]
MLAVALSTGCSVASMEAPTSGEAWIQPRPEKEVQVVLATEAKPVVKLTLDGVAYIPGHGGHIAVIDLRTMKAPVNLGTDRIVITEAGSEMEGMIAGKAFEKVKKAGGIHGLALLEADGKKVLVVGTLSGDVYKYDLATKRREGPYRVGRKFCDAVVGPEGHIYFEDMADGRVYIWDPERLKTVGTMPVARSVCGIQWTRNAGKAYITDMLLGGVFVYDWGTKRKVKEIQSPEMTFIHQARMTPDGRELWVSAANEFDPGLKPGTHKSQIIIIDTTTDEVVRRIILPDDVRPHDFAFTPDGKYALVPSRTYKHDSQLIVMDTGKYEMLERVSACHACHSTYGVEVRIDKGSPLLCGVEVDWNPGR